MSDMRKADDSLARGFWDQEAVAPQYVTWLDDPDVRKYVAGLIAGNGAELDAMGWFQLHLGARRFHRVLSVGCGSGPLERDLIRRNLSDEIDAFDGSIQSLILARRSAEAEGILPRIRYFAADFNEVSLPRSTYDAVFFHQSAHHVGKLEKLFRRILLALKPDGIVYLDEYVGPSRHYWNDVTMAHHRRMFQELIPGEFRWVPELPAPVVYKDPSEAIRSAEIIPQLRIGFEIVARRGYGGNLLSLIYPAIKWVVVPRPVVMQIIERERAQLQAEDESYYQLLVARPKQGISGQFAAWRYFIEPKVRRLVREVRTMVTPRPRE